MNKIAVLPFNNHLGVWIALCVLRFREFGTKSIFSLLGFMLGT